MNQIENDLMDSENCSDREHISEYRREFLYGSDLGEQDLVDLYCLARGQTHFWMCDGQGMPDLAQSAEWGSIARSAWQQLGAFV